MIAVGITKPHKAVPDYHEDNRQRAYDIDYQVTHSSSSDLAHLIG